jgi:antitoxin component YwqK of YwqJK toxin-antitoxin module
MGGMCQKKSEGVYEIFFMTDWTGWWEYEEIGMTYKNKIPVKEGKWTHWYNNGQKKSEGNYRVGYVDYTDSASLNKDGKWTEWHKNGQKKSEGSYKLKAEDWKVSASHKDGKWTTWYENGDKESEENYKDGVEHGEFIFWSDVLDEVITTTFVDGEEYSEENDDELKYNDSDIPF